MNSKTIILNKLLRDINIFFTSHELTFWLDCGTLLGIYRDKALIPWENDIDIGTWKQDFTSAHFAALTHYIRQLGYGINIYDNFISINRGEYVADIKLYEAYQDCAIEYKTQTKHLPAALLSYFIHCLRTPYGANCRPTSSPVRKSIMLICLGMSKLLPAIIRYPVGKGLHQALAKYLYEQVDEAIPKHFFTNLSTLHYQGYDYLAPNPPAAYLQFRYGANWHIPNATWVTARDDGAFKMANQVRMMEDNSRLG